MNRKEMIQFINDKLEMASDADLEAVYWIVELEIEA